MVGVDVYAEGFGLFVNILYSCQELINNYCIKDDLIDLIERLID
jgi:hypothetical protein